MRKNPSGSKFDGRATEVNLKSEDTTFAKVITKIHEAPKEEASGISLYLFSWRVRDITLRHRGTPEQKTIYFSHKKCGRGEREFFSGLRPRR